MSLSCVKLHAACKIRCCRCIDYSDKTAKKRTCYKKKHSHDINKMVAGYSQNSYMKLNSHNIAI